MSKHKFWGQVTESLMGYTAEKKYNIPNFSEQEIEIFLGSEFDEDGDEIDTPPNKISLDAYADTYTAFLNNLPDVLLAIKAQGFERYSRLYAHYYEHEEKSGKAPLNIDTAEKHFEYMRDILQIRIEDNQTIIIPIRYQLDTEHGIEIKLENNQITSIGGIGES
ncbi:hypothetical protein AY601_0314 [Pedobacter cryoconitis]|uniref:DUF6985 domain-containing protein n=1 Tax=Pedobacter cryoconitis TaxID=188932 RepID=A0A127V7U3_9SPHI|nr:hypothetical protein [Pedobacter cryoconitis]AMP97279.1 hypothetical protein AY601_0314 [Pedobacter cryoconitis]